MVEVSTQFRYSYIIIVIIAKKNLHPRPNLVRSKGESYSEVIQRDVGAVGSNPARFTIKALSARKARGII